MRDMVGRRRFLASATAATAAAAWAMRAEAAAAARAAGFRVGLQCWTFRLFPVMEAIDMAAKAGAKVIEFFPGQAYSAEHKDVKFSHDAPNRDDLVKAVLDRCREKGLTPMNYGVVGVPKDEKGAAKVFSFAKALGLYGVTTESADAVATLEKMAKEFDLKVCFHNHPQRKNDPNYKVWNPAYIKELVADRDARLGACADTGHWLRSGIDPVAAVKLLSGRVHATHLKDLDAKNRDVVWGKGVGKVADVLAELRGQGFVGNVSIEYETKWEANQGDVTDSVAWFRALEKREGWAS